jgi:hypothetical protein
MFKVMGKPLAIDPVAELLGALVIRNGGRITPEMRQKMDESARAELLKGGIPCETCGGVAERWIGDTPYCNVHGPDRVAASLPDDIRARGWMVGVHNDYRQGGVLHTFWLFTKGNVAIKGEGRTDAEALNRVRAQLDVFDPVLCTCARQGADGTASTPCECFTVERVHQLLAEGAKGARDLQESLDRSFRIPEGGKRHD